MEPANSTVYIADPTCGIALASGANVGTSRRSTGESFVGGEISVADARRMGGSPASSKRRRTQESGEPVYSADPTCGIAEASGSPESGSGLPGVETKAEDTAKKDGGCTLVVVYWNVAGIPKASIDSFLKDMDMEVRWDVLILLEFSVARIETHTSGIRDSGHLLKAQSISVGRRAGAIVINKRLGIRHMDLISRGRAFGGDISWGGWKIRLIGGHADAGGDRRPYQKSIDDIEFIVDSTPHDHIVIMGADTQEPLGPQKAYDNPNLIGEFAMGYRGWKGERFLRMLGQFDFHLPHTFVQGFDLLYTGVNNGKSEPKQMDYMATTAPRKWITKAKRGEYDTTLSDHWPLVLSLIEKNPTKAKREVRQTTAKPIGWMLTEFTYNDDIRVKIGLEPPVDVAEIMQSAFHVYTDGSYTGARNIHTRSRRTNQRKDKEKHFVEAKAGWAAVFFDKGPPPSTEMNNPLKSEGREVVLKGRVVSGKENMHQGEVSPAL